MRLSVSILSNYLPGSVVIVSLRFDATTRASFSKILALE